MRYVIDRIEEGIAVCRAMSNGGKTDIDEETDIEIGADALPPKTKEGDVIVGENGTFVVDVATTAKRRADLTERMNRLFKK